MEQSKLKFGKITSFVFIFNIQKDNLLHLDSAGVLWSDLTDSAGNASEQLSSYFDSDVS